MMHDFSGKTVLVTGAASGIGRAVAHRFADAGATVIATDINQPELEAHRMGYGESGHTRVMDAGVETDIAEAAAWVKATFGQLDVLVNNAGAAWLEPISTLTDELMERQWRVLLKGPMLSVKHFAPLLMESAVASVINIASIAAIIQARNHAVYCACKAGITKFTKDCVKEYPAVRSNVIQPGFIDTPILRAYGEGEDLDALKEDIAARTPAGRLGAPDDIARACLFLASDDAAFVNGATLVVDGGVTATTLEFL